MFQYTHYTFIMYTYIFLFLGVYLKDTILNVLRMYKIEPDQVYTITSDNGANMLKAVNLIEKEILELQQQDSENVVDIVELDSSDNDSTNSR